MSQTGIILLYMYSIVHVSDDAARTSVYTIVHCLYSDVQATFWCELR